jgi:benzodiazapine receptor
MSWYDGIRKPTWAPPSSWFSVAWSIIYVCFSIFGLIIVASRPYDARIVAVYILAWLVNLLWIPLFRRSTSAWSAVWIGLLLVLVLALAFLSLRRGGPLRWGAILLAPYILWLLVALPLAASIAHLN